MAATTGVFTDESAVSVTFNPSQKVSEVIIDGEFNGQVDLQVARPVEDPVVPVWITIYSVIWNNEGVVRRNQPVATPDPALDYRFAGRNIVGTANYYFGP